MSKRTSLGPIRAPNPLGAGRGGGETARVLGSEGGELSWTIFSEPDWTSSWDRDQDGSWGILPSRPCLPCLTALVWAECWEWRCSAAKLKPAANPWGQQLRWLVGGHPQSLPNHSSTLMSKKSLIEGLSQSSPRIWAPSTPYVEVFKQNHLLPESYLPSIIL